MKIRKNVSLSPDTVVKLDALAKANSTTASGILTQLIAKASKCIR